MKVIFNSLLIFGCLFSQNISAQLYVGDKVPDLQLNGIINYKSKTSRISNFEGKILILDFWSTGCVSCIESWPKLLHLQSEFEGKIQIIIVNPWQSDSVVKEMIDKRKKLKGIVMNLPAICGDTSLLQYFPVNGVPHVVWVDQNRKVASITAGDVLNSRNINLLLSGQKLQLHQKNDSIAKYNLKLPLFINGNGVANQVLFSSVLTSYQEAFRPTMSCLADSTNGYVLYMINNSIRNFVRFAYSDSKDMYGDGLIPLSLSRIELDVVDSTMFVDLVNGEANYKNLYSYHLFSSKSCTIKDLQKAAQEDILKMFKLDVKWVKKKKKCLVMSLKDTLSILYKEGSFLTTITDSEFKVNDVSFDYIMGYMEAVLPSYYYSPYPLINETGYTKNIGLIDIKTNSYDYKSLGCELAKYGIVFKLADRIINVLEVRSGLN